MEELLGSFSADLDAIDTEIKTFINMIEDTDQYISVHLDSVRNEIIKMTLFMEVGGLVMGFGAFLGERSGMNLSDHVEVKPAANFYHKKPGVTMGFPLCLHQHCFGHDLHLPWLCLKVSLVLTEGGFSFCRQVSLLLAGITS